MQGLMIDLETLSTKKSKTPVIVSIGAVQFDPCKVGAIGKSFYRVVDISSCTDRGMHVDASTLAFWMDQPDEARSVITENKGRDLEKVLKEFSYWVTEELKPLNPGQIYPWGNSSDFDMTIMCQAYEICGLPYPFHFWNHRDVRTVMGFISKSEFKQWKVDNARTGTYHNAKDDAIYQAKYVQWLFNLLGVEEYY